MKLAKNNWSNQMAQVGTSWSMFNKWNKEKRVSRSTWNRWNKNKGVFRSTWNKWNKDKGSVQLNLSTCAKVSIRQWKLAKVPGLRRVRGERRVFME